MASGEEGTGLGARASRFYSWSLPWAFLTTRPSLTPAPLLKGIKTSQIANYGPIPHPSIHPALCPALLQSLLLWPSRALAGTQGQAAHLLGIGGLASGLICPPSSSPGVPAAQLRTHNLWSRLGGEAAGPARPSTPIPPLRPQLEGRDTWVPFPIPEEREAEGGCFSALLPAQALL